MKRTQIVWISFLQCLVFAALAVLAPHGASAAIRKASYDVVGFPGSLTVPASAHVTGWNPFTAVFAPLIIIAIQLATLASVIRTVVNTKIPESVRRRRSLLLQMLMLFVTVFVYMPLACLNAQFYRQSKNWPAVTDAWFGHSRPLVFGILWLAPIVSMIVCMAVASFVQQRSVPFDLKGQKAALPAELEARKRIRKWQRAVWPVGIALALLGWKYVPHRSPLLHFLPHLTVLLTGVVEAVLSVRLRNELEPRDSDPELTQTADRMAAEMGFRLEKVEIDDSGRGRTFAKARLVGKTKLLVSRKLVEILSPDELQFAIAQALARRKPERPASVMLMIFVSLPEYAALGYLVYSMWIAASTRSTTGIVTAAVIAGAACLITMPLFLYVHTRIRVQRALDIDREALRRRPDLAAAESCITKLQRGRADVTFPGLGSISGEPPIIKRIESLHSAAAELGIR